MQQVAFIINPFSAKGNYHNFLRELLDKVPGADYFISNGLEGTDTYIISRLDTHKIFVAVGGDGTISNVARHLVHTDKILAIFPAGSGNGFSNETHFKKNVDDLLQKISAESFRTIDTFTVNGQFSINVSGCGFDGKVVKEFEKTSRGFLNYIRVSLKTFFRYKPIKIKFLQSELKKHNGKYLMLNIANTRQFGNHAYIAPHASKSDGLLEFVLVKKFPLWYSPGFALKMFTKKLKEDNYITYLTLPAADLKINTKNWHVDGEYRKIKSPVRVEVQPASLRILT